MMGTLSDRLLQLHGMRKVAFTPLLIQTLVILINTITMQNHGIKFILQMMNRKLNFMWK